MFMKVILDSFIDGKLTDSVILAKHISFNDATNIIKALVVANGCQSTDTYTWCKFIIEDKTTILHVEFDYEGVEEEC